MRVLLVLLTLLASTLAGCIVEPQDDTLPRLQLVLSQDSIAFNEELEVEVRFVNTADRPFEIDAPDGCPEVQVWVRVDGDALQLDGNTGSGCDGQPRTLEVRPGDSLGWGPFHFLPEEYQQSGADVFKTGQGYEIGADLRGSTTWAVRNTTKVEVTEPMQDLEITVTPENETLRQGETIAIVAELTNTRDEPYTYRSSDNCNDIHVWIEDTPDGKVRLYPKMEPYFCGQALTTYTLQPGEVLRARVHWDGSADGRGGDPFVPQGPYTIRAALDGKTHLPQGHGNVFVQTQDGRQ